MVTVSVSRYRYQ